MTKNKESTRYFSSNQETKVASVIDGYKTLNSGAGKFTGGDVRNDKASLLVECKTCTSDKTSFSIKQEWLKKIKEEAFETHTYNTALAFDFGPNCKEEYFIIDQRLMKFLVEKLIENMD